MHDNKDTSGNVMESHHTQKDRSSRYEKAIELIVQKCEALSADNERLVHRLHYVKKITKRKERDVAILKRRLDVYNDGWRTAQPEHLFKVNMPTLIPANNNVIVRKKYKKREKPAAIAATMAPALQTDDVVSDGVQTPQSQKHTLLQLPPPSLSDDVIRMHTKQNQSNPIAQTSQLSPQHDITAAVVIVIDSSNGSDASTEQRYPQQRHQQSHSNKSIVQTVTCPSNQIKIKDPSSTGPAAAFTVKSTKPTKEPKRKRARNETREKDPNAPKRPANPFFQFCQEQRSILMSELNNELLPGQPELSKQELTRQLANRWRSLDLNGKQVYINMYENSKQKYNDEMQSYRIGGGGVNR